MSKRKKKLVHRSIRHDRTLIKDSVGRREKVFATAWRNENKPERHGMMGPHCSRLEMLMVVNDRYLDVSQETATAVATIIQWLGAPMGFSFLEDTLRKAGYSIVPIKK